MTRNELLRRYPNASASFIQRNLDCDDSVPNPVAQPPVQHEPARKDASQEGCATRLKVRVISFRRRLLDADNLAGGSKFVIDALRYAGLIRDDNPEDVDLSFSQFRSAKEETVVMISHQQISPTEAADIYARAYSEVKEQK